MNNDDPLHPVTALAALVGDGAEFEQRYRAIFEQSPYGIVVFDTTLRVLDCNARFAELLGFAREHALGFELSQLHESAVRDNLHASVSGATRCYTGPYRSRLSGREVLITLRTAPLHDAAGRLTGGVAMAEDTTEQWRLQQRLQAQFKGIPVATFAWQHRETPNGFDFVLVDYNDAADVLSRHRLASLLGKGIHSGFSHPPSVPGDMLSSLKERKVIHREVEHVMNSTGEVKTLSVTYNPVAPDLVLTHSEDVTERRGLEEKLRQAQKMEAVGQLAGGIAHDFNNLLTVIVSHCSLLLHSTSESDARHADLVGIQRAAKRASELTNQLLAFSRRQLLQPSSLDLNDVLTDLEPMLRRLIGENIRIALNLDPQLDHVLADRGQVEQVVLNLAVNARDAMPQGGSLIIATERQDEAGAEVALRVTDTGIGMDRATQARIFEPFFTTKEPGRGTGLGLSTVYGIVQQSGGQIGVRSEPGRGATFCLTFPRHGRSEPELTPATVQLEVQPGSGTILLAEDLDSLRALCSQGLRQHGYEVIAARDGRHALDIAEHYTGALDLLVTDMVMPELGGRELFEALAKRRPDLRVLYMSGYIEDEEARVQKLGPHQAFLQKPFDIPRLLAAVRTLLARNKGEHVRAT